MKWTTFYFSVPFGILLDPNMPPRVNVDPLEKTFPKLVPGKKSLGLDILTKGKPSHGEKFPPRDALLWKGVLTHGKLKPLDVLLPPA